MPAFIDLTHHLDDIQQMYEDGMTCEQIAEAISRSGPKVSRGKIMSMLKASGALRNIQASARLNLRHAREAHHSERTCEHCHLAFGATNPAQKHCRSCAPDNAAVIRLRRYGINQNDYLFLKERQELCCGICRQPLESFSRIHVDHCHASGRVRGLLCSGCNTGLGFLERKDFVRLALSYLKDTQ